MFRLKNNINIVLMGLFVSSLQVNAVIEHAVTFKHAKTGQLITLLGDRHIDEESMQRSKKEQAIVLARAKKSGAALIVEDTHSQAEFFFKKSFQ